MNYIEQIKNYIPYDEQEVVDKEYFLKFIESFDDVLTRENIFGHFCSSAFVVNRDKTKMVVVYHIINDGWMYPGGHVDGEEDFLSVAIREVEEETGLKTTVLSDGIYAIQSLPTQSHIKKGSFIPTHTHFDVIYLLEADDNLPLIYREDESKGVKWIDFNDAYNEEMVPFIRPIHKKLIKKLKQFKNIKC